MKKIVLDIDCIIYNKKYNKNNDIIKLYEKKIESYKDNDFDVVIYSSSGMISSSGKIKESNDGISADDIITFSSMMQIADEIFLGKPPVSELGLVIDDKAVTPSEFLSLNYEQIKKLTLSD